MSNNESMITSGMARIALQDAQLNMLMDVTSDEENKVQKVFPFESMECGQSEEEEDTEVPNKFAWIGPAGDPGPEVSGKFIAEDNDNQHYNRFFSRPLEDDDSFFSEDYFEEDFLWDDDYC